MTPLTLVQLHEWVADRDEALKEHNLTRAEAIRVLLANYGIRVETRSDNSTHVCGQG
jgi:cysteinyl-tRNA synthetase